MSDFYVGYLPKAPAALARRTKRTVALLLILAVAVSALFVISQRTVSTAATFEFGHDQTFEGILVVSPYPALFVARPNPSAHQPQYSYYSLVAPGKHGADAIASSFDRRAVRLRGTLIYREDQTMVEVVPGSIATLDRNQSILPASDELGRFTLTGEIVDSKCNFGVMNPGRGKVHKDCAARCLSGGIPPAFVTADLEGQPATLILTAEGGKPLPKETFLGHVAQPLQLRGVVRKTGDELFFEVEPSSITNPR
jgi:hypothetical protein